jgi:hypothetical protein
MDVKFLAFCTPLLDGSGVDEMSAYRSGQRKLPRVYIRQGAGCVPVQV